MKERKIIDWVGESRRVLPLLSPSQFTHKGIANLIGIAPGTLRQRSESLIEVDPYVFKERSSHRRWLRFNKNLFLQEALQCKTGEQLERKVREKFGLKISCDNLKEIVSDTPYRVSPSHECLLYRPCEFENSLKSYLFGYFLGDGGYTKSCVSWYTTKKGWLERFVDNNQLFLRSYREGYFNQLIDVNPDHKTEFLQRGVPERKTYQNFEVNLSGLDWVEVLAGWVDSDGWMRKSECCYNIVSSSKKLCESVIRWVGDGRLLKPQTPAKIELQTLTLSKEFSVFISMKSRYLIKRLDREEAIGSLESVRKKSLDTRAALNLLRGVEI